jgi:hypothetical protein
MPPRTKWKTQYQVIEENSKFHNDVRAIFATDPFFSRLKCFQEVPVIDICPDYHTNLHRFDWYIEDLGIVLELHGEQHSKLTNRGSIKYEEAEREFLKAKVRDYDKYTAAENNKLIYKVILYKEAKRLTAEKLKQIILSQKEENET